MELKTFISEVLCSIMAGINESERLAMEYGAIVNPRRYVTEEDLHGRLERQTQVDTQHIEFDVAVTIEHGNAKDAGGRITVMGVGVGGKLEATSKQSSVSRVKFSLPVVLPSVGTLK